MLSIKHIRHYTQLLILQGQQLKAKPQNYVKPQPTVKSSLYVHLNINHYDSIKYQATVNTKHCFVTLLIHYYLIVKASKSQH